MKKQIIILALSLMINIKSRKRIIIMALDFVPREDALFDNWQRNLVTVINSYISTWGLSADQLAEWAALTVGPTSKKVIWDNAWAIVQTKEFKHSQETKKKQARQSYESGKRNVPTDSSLRLFITRYIRNNPKVTDDQKKEMRLTVPDEVLTPTSDSNEKITGTELNGKIKKYGHLSHTSEVIPVGKKSKAKGKGVDKIEIWIAITDGGGPNPPAPDPKAFSRDGYVKNGLFTHTFDPTEEGRRAWYYAVKITKGKTAVIGKPSKMWTGIIP